MDEKEIHQRAAEYHLQNTDKVFAILQADYDLSRLNTVLGRDVAEIYQRILPRYAQLCEIDQARGLSDVERCELAVCYASLYPTFGDSGILLLAATWIATRPMRQARNS